MPVNSFKAGGDICHGCGSNGNNTTCCVKGSQSGLIGDPVPGIVVFVINSGKYDPSPVIFAADRRDMN